MSSQDKARTETFGEWLAQFLPGSRAYRSGDNHVVLILNASSSNASAPGTYLGNHVFLRGGLLADVYQQLNVIGYGRTGNKTNWTCEHPDGRRFALFLERDVMTVLEAKGEDLGGQVLNDGWKHYHVVPENERNALPAMIFLPLPDIRVPEYLFFHPDGRMFYVDAPKYNDGRPIKFRCFAGSGPGLIFEIEVLDVQRLKDGGTTILYTSAGTLFSPPPSENGKSFYYPFDVGMISIDVLRRRALPGTVEIRQIPCLENEAVRELMAWMLPE